ncbi:hypothetical protein FA95DRAFT_686967 [Auriscalpium vulgare]|uniref:Uncharacterized protein n=1 Tax=Auriscalpium vulgare TaxID=40419 RepID=A0ACB8S234_9AGAM|nr:hypothetical protein FA95DRAFT_686967 [Auriscalpium vulgare]
MSWVMSNVGEASRKRTEQVRVKGHFCRVAFACGRCMRGPHARCRASRKREAILRSGQSHRTGVQFIARTAVGRLAVSLWACSTLDVYAALGLRYSLRRIARRASTRFSCRMDA